MKHSDLFSLIQDKIKTIPIPITWIHVHEHQKASSKKLTPNTILNKRIDKLEMEINWAFKTPTERQCKGDQCTIRVQGQLITGNVKNRLKHILLSILVKEYISSKKIIGKGSAPLVHWPALANSRRTTFHQNVQKSKWVCN